MNDKKEYTIDLCPNRADYYTQLNNEQDPFIACQATTAAQCINIVDDITILKVVGTFKQPEDNLRHFCKCDKECAELLIRSHGESWKSHVQHPSEWADVLVFAVNKIMGYKCARFENTLTSQIIAADLAAGLPVQASVRFPFIDGHYVSVVGATNNGGWIINDPYRDWLHDGADGYHVIYTPAEWAEHCKGYGIRYSRRQA